MEKDIEDLKILKAFISNSKFEGEAADKLYELARECNETHGITFDTYTLNYRVQESVEPMRTKDKPSRKL